MARKTHLLDRLMTAAELPSENTQLLPFAELVWDKRVIIENHKGIVQYCKDVISVKVKNGAICVCGRGLTLAHMSRERIVIVGCIDAIKLERGM